MAKNIKIGKGNTTTGELELSDNGYTKANKGRTLKWKIRRRSNVDSFDIELKSNPDNIFSVSPYKDGNQWKARIDPEAKDNAECKYSIFWYDQDKNKYELDPKIAVNPIQFSPYWLIVILLGIIGLFSLKSQLLAKRKN